MGRIAIAVLSVVAFTAAEVTAQMSESLPKFEEASFKQSPPANGKRVLPSSRMSAGRVENRHNGLRGLIVEAFQVQWDQVVGPPWIDQEHYDLVATMPPGTSRAQAQLMLRSLLVERLKLAVHHTQREEPVYAVEIARGGLKLREAAGPNADAAPFHLEFGPKSKTLTGPLTIPALLRLVSPGLDQHMIDATGLGGVYDIRLAWTPPDFRRPGDAPPARSGDGDLPSASAPLTTDLFVAMEKQLGLKVVTRKGAVDVVVVDHVERVPVEN